MSLGGYHWGKMDEEWIKNASDEDLLKQYGEFQQSVNGFKIKIEVERRNLQKMLLVFGKSPAGDGHDGSGR